MPATVTLSSTTLAAPVSASDGQVKLVSTDGVRAGIRLYVGAELMRVLRLSISPWVIVIRGADGTGAKAHSLGDTVYIGEAHQFYERDPVGRPPEAIPVTPWINTREGKLWFAQGDATSTGSRWWQQQTSTHTVGALGVRTTTLEPESST